MFTGVPCSGARLAQVCALFRRAPCTSGRLFEGVPCSGVCLVQASAFLGTGRRAPCSSQVPCSGQRRVQASVCSWVCPVQALPCSYMCLAQKLCFTSVRACNSPSTAWSDQNSGSPLQGGLRHRVLKTQKRLGLSPKKHARPCKEAYATGFSRRRNGWGYRCRQHGTEATRAHTEAHAATPPRLRSPCKIVCLHVEAHQHR